MVLGNCCCELCLTDEVAHKWSNVFMDGKFDEFVGNARGGK
jgi:hypothetical protein